MGLLQVDFVQEGAHPLQECCGILEVCRVPGLGDRLDARMREIAGERVRDLAEALVLVADDETDRNADLGESRTQRRLRSGPHAAERIGEAVGVVRESLFARLGEARGAEPPLAREQRQRHPARDEGRNALALDGVC